MKFRIIVLFLLLFPLSTYGEDIEVTIYVDDAYMPFSYQTDNQAKGMYIDVLKRAFAKMDGFQVTMKPAPWKRCKYLIESGYGFGLAPAFFHGHDWPYLYPYSLPFYTESIIAVCNAAILKQRRPKWPEDYKGLKIGNVTGFDGWGGDKFRIMVKDGRIDYFELNGSKKIIEMLLRKKCDCIMMENRAFDFEMKRMKTEGIYDLRTGNYLTKRGNYKKTFHTKLKKGAFIGTDPVYIGYSEPAIKKGKYPYAYTFQKQFDVIIYEMIKSGEIDIIMDAYQE